MVLFNTGQLPPPVNLQCMNTTSGLLITWNAVTDTSCAESSVKYSVSVVRQSDGMVIASLTDLDDNETEIINMMRPSIDYNISITARTTIGSCDGQPATIMCTGSAADDNSAGNAFKYVVCPCAFVCNRFQGCIYKYIPPKYTFVLHQVGITRISQPL